jgi:WhiB family redox-sensing transcriptional regulator
MSTTGAIALHVATRTPTCSSQSARPAPPSIETARRICTACLVSEECLEFALATNQEAGIWGGTIEEERRKLRKTWLARQRATA